MELRAMTRAEKLYCYAQSWQINMQTGLIGHLRGDMDSNGMEFYTTFFDFRPNLKTEVFQAEFDNVVNTLRNDVAFGQILGNRGKLAAYCYASPESKITADRSEYGFRVNTENYAYLLRLNPNRGEYNFYIYCYKRDLLDRHMLQAERGIRFIDPHYKEKFRLDDGDKIRYTTKDGKNQEMQIRYIDEYHMETSSNHGKNLFHIAEFADLFESRGCSTLIPLRASLPEYCYSMAENKLIKIVKGESGYYELAQLDANGRKTVDDKNAAIGVTKAQEAAMLVGSMFGWDKIGADPKNYDDQGMPIVNQNRNRGEER